ncbi:MAG: hypothetical protein ACQEP8_03375 [Chlamydiota bacterium]
MVEMESSQHPRQIKEALQKLQAAEQVIRDLYPGDRSELPESLVEKVFTMDKKDLAELYHVFAEEEIPRSLRDLEEARYQEKVAVPLSLRYALTKLLGREQPSHYPDSDPRQLETLGHAIVDIFEVIHHLGDVLESERH